MPQLELRASCGFPETISGPFSGSVSGPDLTLTWNGTLTQTFLASDPVTGSPYGNAVHYRTTAASLTWSKTGRCTGSGTLATAEVASIFPHSQIDLTETTGKGYGYELGLFPNPSAHMPCTCTPSGSGDAVGLVGGSGGDGGALLYTSDSRGPETNRFTAEARLGVRWRRAGRLGDVG